MEKYNMEDMYYIILAYRDGTEIVYNEKFSRSSNPIQTKAYAKVCMSSLCLTLELSLKYLMILSGRDEKLHELRRKRKGHDLSALFCKLTEKDKNLLEDLWDKACRTQALPEEEIAHLHVCGDMETAKKKFEMAKKKYGFDTPPNLSDIKGFLSYINLRNWTKSYYSWDDVDRPFSFFSDMRTFLVFLHLLSPELRKRSAEWWKP